MWPLSIYLLAIVDAKKGLEVYFWRGTVFVRRKNTHLMYKLATLTKHHRRCRGHQLSELERVLPAPFSSNSSALQGKCPRGSHMPFLPSGSMIWWPSALLLSQGGAARIRQYFSSPPLSPGFNCRLQRRRLKFCKRGFRVAIGGAFPTFHSSCHRRCRVPSMPECPKRFCSWAKIFNWRFRCREGARYLEMKIMSYFK